MTNSRTVKESQQAQENASNAIKKFTKEFERQDIEILQ